MFIHNVIFKLKKELRETDVDKFKKGLDSLIGISSVKYGFYGTPAVTDRPIIVREYDFGLTIVNEDYTSHMAYQEDPIHDRFREECGPFFENVVIYDYD